IVPSDFTPGWDSGTSLALHSREIARAQLSAPVCRFVSHDDARALFCAATPAAAALGRRVGDRLDRRAELHREPTERTGDVWRAYPDRAVARHVSGRRLEHRAGTGDR